MNVNVMYHRISELLLTIIGGSFGILLGGISYGISSFVNYFGSNDGSEAGAVFAIIFSVFGIIAGILMDTNSKQWSVALGVTVILGFAISGAVFLVPGILFAITALLRLIRGMQVTIGSTPANGGNSVTGTNVSPSNTQSVAPTHTSQGQFTSSQTSFQSPVNTPPSSNVEESAATQNTTRPNS
ncbi:hypothetical protein GXN76_10095 [Kroppenstedtia pulmonis]|uniref:DUF4064 domain-containing protein n=1 Tax=Kroppenstedtia pulmonis TaxID=1380685 RepID=A0A7D4BKA3_9BACL|nr:DUF4064 domain-containing protein [Kroppenstedtia pulmonis]QKG84790.1 hypothetical protein GXN76_10095 [Kroppenstedtia pulmonis]